MDWLVEGIANYTFGLAFKIVLYIGNAILQLALLLLNWVTSEGFINWTYTTPAGNPIINIGWTLTRDLSNMFLVIVLVIIGLGTALKVNEYEVKKTLPRLIGIALLINFTPIIAGLVVDAANILMNFFLEKLSGLDAMGSAVEAQYSIISQTLISGTIILGILPALYQTIIIFIFDVLAATVVFLFAALFAMRYVAIWMLVILSPIAFASYILPATKGIFKTWWNQFIQWSIVGVTAAFFLYLGNHILVQSNTIINPNALPGTGFSPSFTNFIQSLMPLGIALIFLMIGFFSSISGSAMGSSGVISFAQKGAKATGAWAGRKTGTAFNRRISPKVESWGKGLAGIGSEEKQKKIASATGLAKFGWGVRGKLGGGIAAGAGRIYREVKTSDENEINAGKKEATNKDSADNFRIINEEMMKGPLANWNRIVGVLNATVENKDSNDIQEALRKGTLSGKALGRALLTAQQRGGPPAYRPIAKALYGRLLENPEQFGKEFSVRERGGSIERDADDNPLFLSDKIDQNGNVEKGTVGRIVGEIREKITPAEIAAKILGDAIDRGKAGGEEFENQGGKRAIRQMIMARGGDLAPALMRRPESREGRAEMLKTLREISPEDLHLQGADGLIRYLASTTAQGAGIVSPLSPKETDDLIHLLGKRDRAPLNTTDANDLQGFIDVWMSPGATPATTQATPPPPSPIGSPTGGPVAQPPRPGGIAGTIGRAAGRAAGTMGGKRTPRGRPGPGVSP